MTKNNIGLKILVLIISILLWLQQTLLQTHTETLSIPYKIEKIPSDLIPKPTATKTIKVEITARGIDIFLIKFLKSYFKIDASGFRFGKNTAKIDISNLMLHEHLNIKIEKLTIKNKLVISMDRLVTRYKYFHINYASVKDLEYFINNKIIPDIKKVRVRGALSEVKKIKFIETEKISKKMVNNGYMTVRLIPPSKDIVLLDFEIKFRVVQQQLITKTLSLIPIKYPQDKKVTIIPQKVTIMVRGVQSIIENLDTASVTPYIEENQLNKNGFVNIKFDVPKGISVIDYTPRKIQVIKNE